MVGQLEFFYDQAPDVMRSMGMAMQMLSISLGSYLSGALTALVSAATSGPDSPGGWLPKVRCRIIITNKGSSSSHAPACAYQLLPLLPLVVVVMMTTMTAVMMMIVIMLAMTMMMMMVVTMMRMMMMT